MGNRDWLRKHRQNYIKHLQRAKIAVFDSSIYQYMLKKYGEAGFARTAIAANVPLLHPEMGQMVLPLNLHDSAETLASKLNEWLSNDEILCEWSKRAQAFAVKSFRCTGKVNTIVDTYDSWMQGKRGTQL